jgi:hypothetical protein
MLSLFVVAGLIVINTLLIMNSGEEID